MAIDIAIVVSTFERPDHLDRCLDSLAAQRGVDGRYEVVVTDDGSRDDTLARLAARARRVNFPLTFTTHTHAGFQLARCRNEGIAATTAPYLLFTDGDCVLPPDHVAIHLDERRPGFVAAGDCLRLDRAATALVTAERIRRGDVSHLVAPDERRRLGWKSFRARVYHRLRVPMRPRLTGNNIGAWRSDLEAINGFDERFVGWGLEDRDLQSRLARIGVRARPVAGRTAAVHLWHEPAASFVRNAAGTANEAYFLRQDRPAFCRDGLVKSGDDAAGILPLPTRRFFPEPARRAA